MHSCFYEHPYQSHLLLFTSSPSTTVIQKLVIEHSLPKLLWVHQENINKRYLRGNQDHSFAVHCGATGQSSNLFLLESKISLTYLLWVLVQQRGQQLQWYSHFFLIKCLGMLMWKWNLILQRFLLIAAPERWGKQLAF